MILNQPFMLFFYSVEPLVLSIIIIFAAICVSYIMLKIMMRDIWFDKKHFAALSLFFDLRPRDAFKLSSAFVKFFLILSYIISFKQLYLINYLAFLVPALIVIFDFRNILQIPSTLISVAIQFAALISANLLCNYILTFSVQTIYIFIYILISIVTILYSLYIFITEILNISQGRRTLLEISKYKKQEQKQTTNQEEQYSGDEQQVLPTTENELQQT